MRDRRGVVDVFLAFIAGIVLFVLYYLILCYLGYVAEAHIEPSAPVTHPVLQQCYDIAKQGFVDFLNIMPALVFLSFIFYVIYRHFTRVSRGRRVR